MERIKFSVSSDSDTVEYEGRCLGYLTPEEYAAVVHDIKLRKKLIDVRTISLKNLFYQGGKSSIDKKGYRLAIVTNKNHNDNDIKRKLIVSSPLDYISKFCVDTFITYVTEDELDITLTVLKEK